MSLQFSTIPSKRLAASITAAATSIQLSDIKGWDGNDLAAADVSNRLFAVLRNDDNTAMEIMELDPATIASASITILARGLKFNGDTSTQVTANKLVWIKNQTIVELGSHPPHLFQSLKDYIDAAAIAGSVPASTSAAGIVVEATQAFVDAGTKTTTISAVAYDNIVTPDKIRGKKFQDYAADAGATDAYAITVSPAPTAYAAGQVFVFKANTVNTGAATLNVNALGAKTIKKLFNADLNDGDILASQIVTVIYDGTNFQLQNPASANNYLFAADAGSTDAYAVTLSPAPSAYTTGMIVRFSANTLNTGAATLNVNALGAKTIKKAFNTDLFTGDILAGQMIEVIYDGTNFQMLSPVASPVIYKSGITTHNQNDGTAMVIPHGLSGIPKKVRFFVNSSGATSSAEFGSGVYDASGQSSLFGGAGEGTASYASSTSGAGITLGGATSGGGRLEGTVTVDATNITVTWASFGAPASKIHNIIWEANN